MADKSAVERELEEIRAQLGWVRDYLCPRVAGGSAGRARAGDGRARLLGRPEAGGEGFGGARAPRPAARALRRLRTRSGRSRGARRSRLRRRRTPRGAPGG